jgi:hypothetical protein
MIKLNLVVIAVLLAGCTTTVVSYPSVCPNDDKKCQRNLDAQTLAAIGQTEAALAMLCMDTDYGDLVDSYCLRK